MKPATDFETGQVVSWAVTYILYGKIAPFKQLGGLTLLANYKFCIGSETMCKTDKNNINCCLRTSDLHLNREECLNSTDGVYINLFSVIKHSQLNYIEFS